MSLPHNQAHLRCSMRTQGYYRISQSMPTPPPIGFMPTWIHLFNSKKCKKCHYWLQFGKAQDHDELVDEHFIYARDTLLLLHILIELCVNISPLCVDRTYHMIPSNYRTITVVHYLAKLYGSILESELRVCAVRNGCRSAGQAGFGKRSTFLDHILTPWTLIEEGRAHKRGLLHWGFSRNLRHCIVWLVRAPFFTKYFCYWLRLSQYD